MIFSQTKSRLAERIELRLRLLGFAAGTALAALLLFPYSKNGLWFDDSLNSEIWGMVHRFDTTWWDFSIRVLQSWLMEMGRVLFCWPWIYGFFYFVRDEAAIRLAHLAFLVAHIASVVYLLRLVRLSWAAVGIFLLALFSMFQIRLDDPIAAYATFLQVLGIAITLALVCLVKWLKSGSTRWIVAASAIASLSALGYELNLVFFPIALAAAVIAKMPRRAINFAIISVPFACLITFNLLAKRIAVNPYSGTAFGSITAAPIVFVKQLTGTLPGSFYALSAHRSYSFDSLLGAAASSGSAWTIVVLTLVVCVMVACLKNELPASPWVWAAAAAFLLLPAGLISLSARYQDQLQWGQAHVPVYYQYFGLAVLVALLFQRFGRPWILMALSPFIALHLALNWSMNLHQVAVFDAMFAEPRISLVSALQHGLMGPVRDGDTVVIKDLPIFINGNLIYQAVQKRVYVPGEAAIAGWFTGKPRVGTITYRLYRDAASGYTWRLDRIHGTSLPSIAD